METVIRAVLKELADAQLHHPQFNSRHEAYAVILEELDECWDEIKSNNSKRAYEEMIQVAAMALRYLDEFRG